MKNNWWCEKLRKNVLNVVKKLLNYIRIKALKVKDHGFPLHGLVQNVDIPITLQQKH